MSHSAYVEKKAFFWFFAALLVVAIYVISPFLNTLLVSLVLAVLFFPFHNKILRWVRGREGLAAVLSVLSVIILLLVPITIIFTILTAQIANVIQAFPKDADGGDVSSLLTNWENYITPILHRIEGFFGANLDLLPIIKDGIQKLGVVLAQYSPAVLTGAGTFFFDLFIMLVLLFYFFRDGPKLFKKLIVLSPIKDQYEMALAKEIKQTIYGVFYGSFLTGLVQAVFATIGYYIAHIPSALLFGVLTFFVSFIPIVGTAAVIAPLMIYLVVKGHIGYAVFLGIYGGIVIGSSDNILKPLLIRSNIHQALLFLSLFGGMIVFGPLGLLLGPIIMALLTATLSIYEKEYLSPISEPSPGSSKP